MVIMAKTMFEAIKFRKRIFPNITLKLDIRCIVTQPTESYYALWLILYTAGLNSILITCVRNSQNNIISQVT